MKSLSAGVKVATLFILMLVGGFLVWKNLSRNDSGDGYELFARFRDASGLPPGTKIMVAGLPVGEVRRSEVDGRFAKVFVRIRKDVPVWTSGAVTKKARSLLGENYLEIDPGGPETIAPDGTKQSHKLLVAGDQIPKVIEATTPDQLLHRIESTLPNVDAVLLSVKDLSEDVRRIVNGPLASVSTRIDGLVQREAGNVSDIIERANRSMQKIEQITGDLRSITHGADKRIDAILDNLDQASAEAKGLVVSAKSELQQTGQSIRGKLDRLDGVIDNTTSITHKIDSDTGTLGRLVNDPAIADNVEQITDDAKGFLGTLFGLKAYVGLRTEYNVFAKLTRDYVTIELHTRPDKYYLIELEKGPRGDYPTTSLTFDPTVDPNHWIRRTTISDSFRFTFQLAKRFGPLTLRYGLKESTGGVGVDYDVPWFNRSIHLSADVFDASFDTYPRVKLAAAWEIFKHIYVLGGVDELLNSPKSLSIVSGDSGAPTTFDSFRYGRDYFFGGMLRFNDEDLAALLTVGGSALAGLSK